MTCAFLRFHLHMVILFLIKISIFASNCALENSKRLVNFRASVFFFDYYEEIVVSARLVTEIGSTETSWFWVIFVVEKWKSRWRHLMFVTQWHLSEKFCDLKGLVLASIRLESAIKAEICRVAKILSRAKKLGAVAVRTKATATKPCIKLVAKNFEILKNSTNFDENRALKCIKNWK